MLVAPGTLLKSGTYRIEELIAQGGFGSTYRARDLSLDREVAVKAYQGDELPAFLAEARLLASFDHPGIVRVHAVFEEQRAGFLVMELLRGEDLQQLVERDGPLPSAKAVAYIQQAARNLEVLHDRGVVHRDIKPGNLFCTDEDRIVLLDFGSARLLTQARHTAMVTPGYAPPEQYGHSLKPGPWTDLYALAASLVHLVSGSPPPDVVDRLQHDTFRLPSSLPPIVGRALKLKPEERPQTLQEFREGLADANPTSSVTLLESPKATPAHTRVLEATTVAAIPHEPVAQGHQGRVTALAFHGDTMASAGEDHQVLLWSQGIAQRHVTHEEWVNALAFSIDGVLASGGNDRQVYTGAFTGVPREVLSLTWYGYDLYVGMREGRLARIRNGHVSLFQPGVRGNIVGLAVLEKGWLAMACSPSKHLNLYHPESGKLRILEGHSASIRCLAVNDGSLLTGDADGRLFLWQDGQIVKHWKAHHGAVHAVGFSGSVPLSVSQDGTLAHWGPTETRHDFAAGELSALAVSGSGSVAVGTQDGRILFY